MLPGIRDRDLLAVDSTRVEPLDGQVFVVQTDEGLVVKRITSHPAPLAPGERQPCLRDATGERGRPNRRPGGVVRATRGGGSMPKGKDRVDAGGEELALNTSDTVKPPAPRPPAPEERRPDGNRKDNK